MKPHGSFPRSVSPLKDWIDFRLTRAPALYLTIERYRGWINWDKRVYLALVKPGSIVLDIGANTGTHTIMFSHLAGESGKVLAFEPIPGNYDQLRKTLRARMRFANVETFRTAVGMPASTGETVVMRAPGDDLTHASLKLQREESWRSGVAVREYSCPITSIDAHLFASPPARVDFVKIDVEGGELDAIRGGAGTLATHRPLIYCEVDERWLAAFGQSPPELFDCVRSLGYSEARVFGAWGVSALALAGYELKQMFDVSANVLFFSDGHREAVSRFDERFGVAPAPPGNSWR